MSSANGLVSLAPFENQCVPRDCTRAALIGRRPAPLAQFDPSAPQGRTWRPTIFFNKLLRVEIEKIDPGAPPGTWRPKLIWKNVGGNQSEIYDVDTIGILFEYGKKNTECNMVSIKMIPFVDTLNWLV